MNNDQSTRGYKWFVASSLMVVFALNNLDRSILTMLLEPMGQDLDLSDTQLGLMSGLAFAVLYATLGVPIARLADRGVNRVSIISVSIFLWSIMTVFCGFASNFIQMLLARVGVGIGEAGSTPASHSLLAEYFEESERAKPMALFGLGAPIGGAIGLVLGGILNARYGWQVAFIAVGVPGVILAVLVKLLIKDPRQQKREIKSEIPFKIAVKALLGCRTYVHITLGTSLFGFGAYAAGSWAAVFQIRYFSVPTDILGPALGAVALGGGIVGAVLGGWLGDRLISRDQRWLLWVPALALIISIPFTLAASFAPNWWLSMLCFTAPAVTVTIYFGPVFGLIQTLMAPRLRAFAVANFMMVTNLIGIGLGPLVVGILSDGLSVIAGDQGLRYAVAASTIFFGWGAFHYFLAARYLRDDLTKVVGADSILPPAGALDNVNAHSVA